MSDLLDLAASVEQQARALGASQAVAVASRSTHTSLQRRDGKVEQATEATTRGLVVALMIDDRYSSHSTSDLRPEAIREFLGRAVAATRFLEPDPDRRLPDAELCGRGASDEALDLYDPAVAARSAEDRAAYAEALERALAAADVPAAISRAVSVADGVTSTARVATNGFADESREGWAVMSGDLTLSDSDGRRPEASAWYGARYLSELPSAETLAAEVATRAKERLGARPIETGRYPLVLANRVVGRLLGVIGGPLSASAIHQGRSCLAGKLGQRIASPLLSITDDPLRPRGLASRPWDGDGLRARPMPVIADGVLVNYYTNVYYGRKLGWAPTTGGRSNWILPVGERSWRDVARAFPRAIYVDGFLGGNSNATTGDYSFGIRGMLVEHGEKTRSLGEMNLSGNVFDMLARIVALGDDPYTWSSLVSPTIVFEDMSFSGV